MSNTSKVFTEVPIEVPSRSGFDLSHEVFSTLPAAGTIVPISVIPTLPGDRISIGTMQQVQLPPACMDFFGRIDVKLEAFFVAHQSVWAAWNHFISRDKTHSVSTVPGWTIPTSVPTLKLKAPDTTKWSNNFGKGTLTDYLGLGIASSSVPSAGNTVPLLPYLSYQKIIDDFYIDKNIMKPFFSTGIPSSTSVTASTASAVAYLPSMRDSLALDTNLDSSGVPSNPVVGINGLPVYKLRQRLWSKDLFTTCSQNPQQSTPVSVETSGVSVAAGGTQVTTFSIASLRLANSLQKWLERNNIAGFDPSDAQLGHWGVRPSFCMQDRAVFLGSSTQSVVCNAVNVQPNSFFDTMSESETGSEGVGGLFKTSGDKSGSANSFGKGRLVNNFDCHDYGYIFVMMSLVPHQVYSGGCSPFFLQKEMTDFPFPEFANIGDEAVPNCLISTGSAFDLGTPSTYGATFGYNQRYANYKWMRDRVSGLVRDAVPGSSHRNQIEAKVLQFAHDISIYPTIGTGFLEIPTNFLDQVLNAKNSVGGFAAFVDCYLSVKALRELPEFSIPML